MSARRLQSLLYFVTLTSWPCTASPSTAGKQRNFYPPMPPSHPSMACVPANLCCSTCTSSCLLMRTTWYVSFFVPFNLNGGLKHFCFREICSEAFTWSAHPPAPPDHTSSTLSPTRFCLFFQLFCCFSASVKPLFAGGPRRLRCCPPAATQASVMQCQGKRAHGSSTCFPCDCLQLTSIKLLSKTKAKSGTALCSRLNAAAALAASWRSK